MNYMENYGKYDEFGNPLWQATFDYPPNQELILQRQGDIQSISNVTSTYIKQSKDSQEKMSGHNFSLHSILSKNT